MPLLAMAQIRPYFLRRSQLSGPISSTERQPRLRATWHVFSASHFSPAVLKHQKQTDCLMRPVVAALSSSSREGEAGAPAYPAEPEKSPLMNGVDPAAKMPPSN